MIKDEIIPLLVNCQGTTISGETIAKELHITRAAVWKGIRELQKEGYEIASIPGKGYCLHAENDILSSSAIKKHLHYPEEFQLEFHKTVTSTNDIAKERALSHAPEGLVVFSEHQTSGKGRKGRSFYSPEKKGLYMSILLRPSCSVRHSLLITAAAAAAVHDAIKEVCNLETDIKWVNDILIEQKKLCGILCEGSMETDADTFEWVVLGIGVNCQKATIPEDLQQIMTSLQDHCEHAVSRAHLGAAILNHFMEYYKHLSKRAYLQVYRSASCILDKQITVYEGNRVIQGQAIAINDDANLVVKTKEGLYHMFTGEVSVRKI